ncbi:MAG TPA: hypothetical protein VGU25_16485 [Acidobacteriaceae bacterium]|nr:hypothetical protein [Acidobacteriaceae bacterium]
MFFLLWIYFGSEAVSEAAQLARKKIEHRAEGLRHNVHQRSLEIDELLVDLFRFEGIADNPSAIGKSYLLLKEKADLVWLDHQSSVIPEIVSSLPAQLEGIGRNFVTKRTEDSSTER